MITYTLVKYDDGNYITCESCDSEVPLYKCDISAPGQPAGTTYAYYCEVCMSTHAGIAHRHPRQYEDRHSLQMMAVCTNMILDAILDRRGLDKEGR